MSEEQRAQVEEPTAEMREIFGVSFSAAEHFAQMLAEEGELRGLVGPRELPRLWTRHIVNSAAVVPFLPARGSVADVGSGAGFPGIVVALLRPDLDEEHPGHDERDTEGDEHRDRLTEDEHGQHGGQRHHRW